MVRVEARSGTGVEMASSSCCKYGCEERDGFGGYVGGVEGRVSCIAMSVRSQNGGGREARPGLETPTLGVFSGGMCSKL